MSLFSTLPVSLHKVKTHSSVLIVLSGIAITGFLALGAIIALAIHSRDPIPNQLLAAFFSSIILSLFLWLVRRQFVWLLDDGIIKGIQLGSNKVFVVSAVRFTDVGSLYAHCDSGSFFDNTGYSFSIGSNCGWFRGVSFCVKHSTDAATTLEFLMLRVDRSLWDPELEDWAYSWLRKHGKHLPRIV